MVDMLRPGCAFIKIEYASGSSPDVNGRKGATTCDEVVFR